MALPAECVRTYLRPKARTNILQHGFQMCGAYPGRASCNRSYQEGDLPDKKVFKLDNVVGILAVSKWHNSAVGCIRTLYEPGGPHTPQLACRCGVWRLFILTVMHWLLLRR